MFSAGGFSTSEKDPELFSIPSLGQFCVNSSETSDGNTQTYIYIYRSELLVNAKQYIKNFRCFEWILAAALIILLLVLQRDLRLSRRISEGKTISKATIIWKQISLTLLIFIAATIYIAANYLLDSFGVMPIAQILYQFNTNLGGTNWSEFGAVWLELGIAFVVAVLLGWTWKRSIPLGDKKNKRSMTVWLTTHWAGIACAVVCTATIIATIGVGYHFTDYLTSLTFDSTSELYEAYYVDPAEVEVSFPETKKNLIYIYIESAEITASNTVNGGGEADNIIPNLTAIAQKGDDFGGTAKLLNGAIPLTGSTWTVAGMVAQSAGIPLNLNHTSTNDVQLNAFLPGAYTLGDILKANGYSTSLLIGSDANFGNRELYYTTHGGYTINDYKWAKQTGLVDEDYYVWWGYEDTKLFQYAKDVLTELAGQDEPFALTMLTADTHYPEGYLCDECQSPYSNHYTAVLSCADTMIGELVDWIEQQAWADDTVVILAGDHLFMGTYYGNVGSYQRKSYAAILNSAKTEPETTRAYSTMDLFPTTLSALGCTLSSDRMGFGTDLYSNTPTLLEEKGQGWLNYELSLNSAYYDENILR